MLTPRATPRTFADLPGRGVKGAARSKARFDPALEAEYARAYLANSRSLILIVCVVAMIAAILRGAEQFVTESWGFIGPMGLPVVIACSAALLIIAASSAFERIYLPWARIVVPVRNMIVAGHIAAAASSGQADLLMVLPLTLIGPFFFMGFQFRLGLMCGVLTSVSFIANALFLDVATPIAMRASVFLLLSLGACAVIARHLDRSSRAAFLETRINVELAQHDALTGTKNRRVFNQHLATLWPQAIEEHRPIAVLLLDVDHFKAFNDRYGHQAGDETLRGVAQAIQTFACRPFDILARYGGEEFAAVLHDVDGQQALQVAERMRRAVEDLNIDHQGSRIGRVTISIGVAAVMPTRDRTIQGVLQLADQALYDAKSHGRNRIEVMSDEQHKMLVTGVFSRAAQDKKQA
jgi:diguanylate cyclase (GGDEF)-like protein